MVERYIANLATTTKFVHSLLSKDLTVALKLGYLKGGYVSHQSYQFQCWVQVLVKTECDTIIISGAYSVMFAGL